DGLTVYIVNGSIHVRHAVALGELLWNALVTLRRHRQLGLSLRADAGDLRISQNAAHDHHTPCRPAPAAVEHGSRSEHQDALIRLHVSARWPPVAQVCV